MGPRMVNPALSKPSLPEKFGGSTTNIRFNEDPPLSLFRSGVSRVTS